MNILNSAASGLYAIAYKFPSLMDTVYGFFYQAWKESSARIVQCDDKSIFYNEVYKYLKRFMYSLVIGMIAFMPVVFKVFINDDYFEAIYYTPILLMATYFSNISGFYGGIFTAYKDTAIMGTTTIFAAIINLFLNIVLIHTWGLYAAAISTLISSIVICCYRKYKVRKYILLNNDNINLVISLIVTVIILALFYSMNSICQIIGGIASVIFAVYENFQILIIITNKLKYKFGGNIYE